MFRHLVDIEARYLSLLKACLPLVLLTSLFSCTADDERPEFPDLPDLQTPTQEPVEKTTATRPTKSFSIALVGEVRGEIEPCGCPTLPYGGFSRRASLLNELRRSHTLFHLDAGESLLKGFYSNKGDQATARAKTIGRLSKEVGVDAWALGPTDLMAFGLEGLKQIDGPVRVSATWIDAQGEWIFDPFAVITKDDIRLAVIGLSEEPTDPKWQESIVMKDPLEAINAVLPLLPDEVDLIVALGSIDDEKAVRISRANPDISMLLTTKGAHYENPYYPNDNKKHPLLIEAPDRGRYVHLLHLRLNGPRTQPPIQGLKEQEWRDHLLLSTQGSTPKKERLLKRLTQLGTNQNLFFGELIPLNESYDEQSAVSDIVDVFKQESLQQAERKAQDSPSDSEPGYDSAGQCVQCHSNEMAKWSLTQHAKAWESLLLRGEQNNPECIACHSTGFGEVGGFGELTTVNIRKYKSVQCESCHGPMRGHPDDKSILPRPITEQTCLPCHDEANSPQFEYVTYLNKSTCQSQKQ